MRSVRKSLKVPLFLLLLTVSLSLAVSSPAAGAYPTKEVRLIQPYPAGGFNDVFARKLIEGIGKMQLLDKNVISVAMPGANSRTAAQAVLDAPADGHTLFIHHTALVATKEAGQIPIGYEDFEMIGGLCWGPIVIDVRSDSPWKSAQEMLDDVKAKPGKYTMGIPGTGGTAHIAALHFLKMAGVPAKNFRYMPLSGGSETLPALLGNKINVRCATSADGLRSLLAGDTRILISLSHTPIPAHQGAPTLADLGYADSLPIRLGLFARKGTPPEVKAIWADIMQRVAASDDFMAFANERGCLAEFVPADQWKSIYDADTLLVRDILQSMK